MAPKVKSPQALAADRARFKLLPAILHLTPDYVGEHVKHKRENRTQPATEEYMKHARDRLRGCPPDWRYFSMCISAHPAPDRLGMLFHFKAYHERSMVGDNWARYLDAMAYDLYHYYCLAVNPFLRITFDEFMGYDVKLATDIVPGTRIGYRKILAIEEHLVGSVEMTRKKPADLKDDFSVVTYHSEKMVFKIVPEEGAVDSYTSKIVPRGADSMDVDGKRRSPKLDLITGYLDGPLSLLNHSCSTHAVAVPFGATDTLDEWHAASIKQYDNIGRRPLTICYGNADGSFGAAFECIQCKEAAEKRSRVSTKGKQKVREDDTSSAVTAPADSDSAGRAAPAAPGGQPGTDKASDIYNPHAGNRREKRLMKIARGELPPPGRELPARGARAKGPVLPEPPPPPPKPKKSKKKSYRNVTERYKERHLTDPLARAMMDRYRPNAPEMSQEDFDRLCAEFLAYTPPPRRGIVRCKQLLLRIPGAPPETVFNYDEKRPEFLRNQALAPEQPHYEVDQFFSDFIAAPPAAAPQPDAPAALPELPEPRHDAMLLPVRPDEDDARAYGDPASEDASMAPLRIGDGYNYGDVQLSPRTVAAVSERVNQNF